ncbi:MAG: D-glycero-beta-D-manno-heptose-7-phosphate kinase [Deltaproteobacteria bacterium]|nr:D-glycero-beta-D-manno-heptose-7-phosphate kinase [Deltaproteobacteria bacterium]
MNDDIALNFSGRDLVRFIDQFPKARVLVVGDIIMDEYVWGDVNRISPEAPVPVVEVRQETKMLGGAANVINNIASLGGMAVLCGVIGNDPTGREIRHRIEGLGLGTEGILVETGRTTSIKTRVVAHNQQVVRFDRESRRTIRPDNTERLLNFIRKAMKGLDAVVVADYGKGVVTGALMDGLRDLAGDVGIIIAVDPKTGNFPYYQGVDVITPNHHEAGAYTGIEILDEETLIRAGTKMLQDLGCRSVLITQGKDGMTLFEQQGEISHIPTEARKVYDVTGAGDTVISTLCLGLASGMDLKSAAILSNFAAGIVVGEVGTSTVKAEELKRVINGRLR